MSEMIERVARALFAKEWMSDRSLSFDEEMENPITREYWFESARAAITAMREPTKQMLDAAAAAMSPGKRPTQHRVSVSQKHRFRYRAMIDAALSQPPHHEPVK